MTSLQAPRRAQGFPRPKPNRVLWRHPPQKTKRPKDTLLGMTSLQAPRRAQGFARPKPNRGPMPGQGAGGRPEEEDSRRLQSKELQEARKEEGGGARGPMPGQGAGGRPFIPEDHKQGPPYRDEEHLSEEEAQRKYRDFVRSWARFGLSRVCKSCGTLSPAKHCRPTAPSQVPTCRNCRENKTKFRLPPLLPVPLTLQQLKPIEQHLECSGDTAPPPSKTEHFESIQVLALEEEVQLGMALSWA